MNLLQALAAAGAVFSGAGINHEGEPFTGTLRVQRLVNGAALLLHYTAVLEDGSLAHEESTLLGSGPDGRLTLWPVMSELEVVLPHVEIDAPAAAGSAGTDAATLRAVFAHGRRDDASAFREEITLALAADGSLTFAHAWGLPGGDFAERSVCRLRPAAV